jgi:hypothetical protein
LDRLTELKTLTTAVRGNRWRFEVLSALHLESLAITAATQSDLPIISRIKGLKHLTLEKFSEASLGMLTTRDLEQLRLIRGRVETLSDVNLFGLRSVTLAVCDTIKALTCEHAQELEIERCGQIDWNLAEIHGVRKLTLRTIKNLIKFPLPFAPQALRHLAILNANIDLQSLDALLSRRPLETVWISQKQDTSPLLAELSFKYNQTVFSGGERSYFGGREVPSETYFDHLQSD